jgi:FlaA1/EpsC-like NDP-sugar epimerase
MRSWVKFRRPLLIALDALAVNLAALLALLLRFEGEIPSVYLENYRVVAPYLTAISVVVFGFAGLYSGILRYASIDALTATAVGS